MTKDLKIRKTATTTNLTMASRQRLSSLLQRPQDDAIAAATDPSSQRQSSVADPASTRVAVLLAKNFYCA